MDFAKARFNMVEQQIRPWDVLDFDLLDALEAIPREAFVGEEQKNYAYADLALTLPNGGAMLEPKIVARLITRNGDSFSEKTLFDTLIPNLNGKKAAPFGGFDF